MDRQMIAYLPTFLRDYAEFQGIAGGEQVEFNTLWTELDSILANQFVSTAGLTGIARWESILGLTLSGDETLEERRLRVQTKLLGDLPYTMPKLKEMLLDLCGTGNYTVSISNFTLTVRVALTALSALSSVSNLLERVVPVNVAIDLSLLYRTHGNLNACGYTHGDLEEYTHLEIRESEEEEP